jgi:hypothetical protein
MKSNITELAGYVGKTCSWRAALNVTVQVRVVDVRRAFGRLDLLVEPIAGSGQLWIDQEKVEWPAEIVVAEKGKGKTLPNWRGQPGRHV